MFGLDSSLDSLSPEDRERLADLLEARLALAEQQRVLNQMRITHLRDPKAVSEEQVNGYAKDIIAPARSRISEQQVLLLQSSIDAQKLKDMLPMILLAVTQSINIPLLLAALNIEPDMVEDLVKHIKEFIDSGMS